MAECNGYWRLERYGRPIAEFVAAEHAALVAQIMEYRDGAVARVVFVPYAPYGVVASLAGGILDAEDAQERRRIHYEARRMLAQMIFTDAREVRRRAAAELQRRADDKPQT